MPTITNNGKRKWNLARRDLRPGETASFTAEELALVEQLSPAALVALKDGELKLEVDPPVAPTPAESAEEPKPAPVEPPKAKEPKR